MSNDKLTIIYDSRENKIYELDDPQCDYSFRIEVDPSDMSSHQLMGIFAKALAALGYSEFSIMKGACSLAFNEMRDTEMMAKLVKEYELCDLPEEVRQIRERKKMYDSVDYRSDLNEGYEPT